MAIFNERVRSARDAAGLSLMDVAFEVRLRLPRAMWVSVPTLQRLESTRDETQVDPLLVCFLAGLYRVRVSELSPLVAGELDGLRDLLTATSGWTAATAA